jgi:hypothetical protein
MSSHIGSYGSVANSIVKGGTELDVRPSSIGFAGRNLFDFALGLAKIRVTP